MGPMERQEVSTALGLISGNLEALRDNNLDVTKRKILETIRDIFSKYPQFFQSNRVGVQLAHIAEDLNSLPLIQSLQREALPQAIELVRAARFGIQDEAIRLQGNEDPEAQMRVVEEYKRFTKLLANKPQSIALILTQFNKIRENTYGKEFKDALEYAMIAENYQLIPLSVMDCIAGKNSVDSSMLPEMFQHPDVVIKLNQLIPLLKQLSPDRLTKFREHFIHSPQHRPRLDPSSIEGKIYQLIQGIEASVEMSTFSLEDVRIVARQAVSLFSKGVTENTFRFLMQAGQMNAQELLKAELVALSLPNDKEHIDSMNALFDCYAKRGDLTGAARISLAIRDPKHRYNLCGAVFGAFIKQFQQKKDIDLQSAVLVARYAYPEEAQYNQAIMLLFKDKMADFRALASMLSEIQNPDVQSQVVNVLYEAYNENKEALEKFGTAIKNPKVQTVVLNRLFNLYAKDGSRPGMERVALLFSDAEAHLAAMSSTYSAHSKVPIAQRNAPAMERIIFGIREAPREQAKLIKEFIREIGPGQIAPFAKRNAGGLRKILNALTTENSQTARSLIADILRILPPESLVELTEGFVPQNAPLNTIIMKSLIEGQKFKEIHEMIALVKNKKDLAQFAVKMCATPAELIGLINGIPKPFFNFTNSELQATGRLMEARAIAVHMNQTEALKVIDQKIVAEIEGFIKNGNLASALKYALALPKNDRRDEVLKNIILGLSKAENFVAIAQLIPEFEDPMKQLSMIKSLLTRLDEALPSPTTPESINALIETHAVLDETLVKLCNIFAKSKLIAEAKAAAALITNANIQHSITEQLGLLK